MSIIAQLCSHATNLTYSLVGFLTGIGFTELVHSLHDLHNKRHCE